MPTFLKRIEVGTVRDAHAMHALLMQKGFKVGDWAAEMLARPAFRWSKVAAVVETVEAAAVELGFTTEKVRYGDVCDALQREGFVLCGEEVGPQLRLQYAEQPPEEWLMLAMEPVVDAVGYQGIFFLGRGSGGLWLGASRGHPDVMLSATQRFVACRRT